MSIEVGVWRIDQGARLISLSGMDLEERLQQLVVNDISVVDPELMVIGREVTTPGGRIDVLAIDQNGNLAVVELKRDRTPREVVAQILDYASWVHGLTTLQIQDTFSDYQERYPASNGPVGINEALLSRFGSNPVELNASHRLIIVAAGLDPATERIVTYLREQFDMDINAVLFRVFVDDDRQYVTRAWLDDSGLFDDDEGPKSSTRRQWNGEFYVNFEEGDHRSWSDAMKHGFVSAGGGERYKRHMEKLSMGSLVWAYVPGKGYVGYGRVTAPAVRYDQFTVRIDDENIPITEAKEKGHLEAENPADVGYSQYFVRVEWVKAVSAGQAVREPGFFSNPNTVCAPTSEKWQFTIDFLKRRWSIQ